MQSELPLGRTGGSRMGSTQRPPYIQSWAVFDSDACRLELGRIWDYEKPLVLFVGLNPSDAGASIEEGDDPTAGKWSGFAHRWGFGG